MSPWSSCPPGGGEKKLTDHLGNLNLGISQLALMTARCLGRRYLPLLRLLPLLLTAHTTPTTLLATTPYYPYGYPYGYAVYLLPYYPYLPPTTTEPFYYPSYRLLSVDNDSARPWTTTRWR